MAESNGGHEGRIRTYLEHHGGSVEDAGGRGLTDEMARVIGVDKPATLSAILGRMEADGVITRDMRGLRTYRIALADGIETADAEPAAPGPAEHPGYGAVTLREALARKPSSVVAPARDAATAAAGVDIPPAELTDPGANQPTRSMSLRDAISRQAHALPVSSPSADPPGPSRSPGAPAVGQGAVSLRHAIAAATGTGSYAAPPRYAHPEDDAAAEWSGRVATLRDTSWQAPPPSPSFGSRDDVLAAAESTRRARRRGASGATRSRPRPHLPGLVPSVNAAPSTAVVTAVVIAVAGLILIAVITVVATRGTSHTATQTGTISASSDACNVVNQDVASAAFGDDAGLPHFVLGSCVYDDGHQELVVEVARRNAQALFAASRTESSQDVAGIGDGAYYDGATLRVLKGSSLILLTIQPFSPAAPSPKLRALATAAVGRL